VGAETPQPGDVIDGRFEVGAIIGAGSFGIVFRARDRDSGDAVAIKMLRPNAFSMPDLVERFGREADICEQLTHPNTVRLLHFGEVPQGAGAPGVPYMVLDLVRGLPLGGLLDLRGRVNLDEAVHVLGHVLDSLQEAHMLGILHRDLKPNNILLVAPPQRQREPGPGSSLFERLGLPGPGDPLWQDVTALDVKVVDFGLGKVLEVGGRRVKQLTQVGVAAGTAEYMSPEQIRCLPDIDHRADLYGVAMLIHRLLAGSPTYSGETVLDVAGKHLKGDLPALPAPYDQHGVAAVFARAGHKDRDQRYGSAAEMAWALRRLVDPALGDAPPPFEVPPEVDRRRKGFFSRLFGR
jgi:serine/threonine-protein kinase